MTSDALVQYSALDSARFGVRIGRAELREAGDVARALVECEASATAMLIARCPSARIEVAQALAAAGGALMDTLVYFVARTGVGQGAAGPDPAHHVRAFVVEDLPALEAVARTAFAGDVGHYHADRRLDPVQATEGYVEWFRRSTLEPDVTVLVAVRDQAAVGFLSLRRAQAGRRAEIVLNAVAPSAQGLGLFDALIKAALHTCRTWGEAEVLTSTQLCNLAPQKVWVRNGFEPLESHYTFHCWFVGPDAGP